MSRMARLKQRLRNCFAIEVIRHSTLFDEAWYRANVGTPLLAGESAAAHYWHGGWRQFDPSPKFDTALYLRDNPDVAEAGVCPLYHYERHGKREGGRNTPFATGRGHYRAWRVTRGMRRQLGRLRCRTLIKSNKSARILVCLQLFYPESWREIKEYLQNLAPYSYDLLVTYQKKEGMAEVIKAITAFHPQTKAMVVENIGFDMGGFQTALRQVALSDYDIVFKLHSKGTSRKHTYVYHHYFGYRDWFVYLYEGILGARTAHQTIYRLLTEPTCGLVAAENLILSDPPHKQRLLQRVLQPYSDVSVPPNYRYVAGTCFAQRAALLKSFVEAEFDFSQSRRGEFSLAHALERVLCFPAQQNGFKLAGNRVCGLRQAWCRLIGRRFHTDKAEALMNDPRFMLDDEFYYRDVEHLRIKGYELTEVRLGEVRRRWFDGTVKPLRECAPYRYLCGDKSAYDAYCAYHASHTLSPMTKERFDALVQSIEKDGFDPCKPLVLRADYTIMDGQHRACCLLKLYGEDYLAPAVVLK